MSDDDSRWRHTEPLRDARFGRLFGAAGFGHRAHARLQHAFAAMNLDAGDFVLIRFWCQPHGNNHALADAAQRQRERLGRGRAQADGMTAGASQPSSTTSRTKRRSRIRITGEMSMPPRLGRMLRIGLSAGSVSRERMSSIDRTNRLFMLTTLKATSQLKIALAITTQI